MGPSYVPPVRIARTSDGAVAQTFHLPKCACLSKNAVWNVNKANRLNQDVQRQDGTCLFVSPSKCAFSCIFEVWTVLFFHSTREFIWKISCVIRYKDGTVAIVRPWRKCHCVGGIQLFLPAERELSQLFYCRKLYILYHLEHWAFEHCFLFQILVDWSSWWTF